MLEQVAKEEGREFDVRKQLGPAGVKSAYENVKDRIRQTDDDVIKTGEGLVLNLLHEKASELSKFANKEQTPKQKLLEGNYDEPTEKNEARIRMKIQKLLADGGDNLPDDYHTNESVK